MDTKAVAVKGLKSACKVFLQDLQALPEEAFGQKFSPSTRTVADIVYEVNLVNDDVGRVMRGEKPMEWPEGWITAPADFQTKAEVINGFESSSSRVIDMAESFSTEEFEAPLKTDEGETTRFERCRFMMLHIWYHSGQLNFIQTLIGDDAWHWK